MNKVIILHGWTKNSDKWQTFLNVLEAKGVKAGFLKVPGPTGGLSRIWKLEDYVQWLKNITDKEKEKVILIGQSNGGRISLAFTNLFPQKVEKLILIDCAGIYHNDLPLRIKRIVFKTIAKFGKKLTTSKSLKNLLYKFARESDYKDLNQNAKKTMINLLDSDRVLNISNISVPTLIIWGEKDKITPLSDGILINSLIKNSKMNIVKDAGHSPQYTNPLETVNLISDFINN